MNYLTSYLEKTKKIRAYLGSDIPLSEQDRMFIYAHGLATEQEISHYSDEELMTIVDNNNVHNHQGVVYILADRAKTSNTIKKAFMMFLLKHPEFDIFETSDWNDEHFWMYQNMDSEVVSHVLKKNIDDKKGFFTPQNILPHLYKMNSRTIEEFFHKNKKYSSIFVDYILNNQEYIHYLIYPVSEYPHDEFENIVLLMEKHAADLNDTILDDNLTMLLFSKYDSRFLDIAKERGLILKNINVMPNSEIISYPWLKEVALESQHLSNILYMASERHTFERWHTNNIDILAFYCHFNQYTCRYDRIPEFQARKQHWKDLNSIFNFQECFQHLKKNSEYEEINIHI